MIPWEHLDSAKIPDGGELRLMRRGTEYSIMSGAIELMNSRLSGSERALATLACERIAGRPAPAVLIGGLGMGFTLRAALGELPADAKVVVAELVPTVVAWARGPMAHILDGSLDDPRVSVREGDVAEAIRQGRAIWDAILLDVDNGPGGLNREANNGLYTPGGLAAARRSLKPGGVLTVWAGGAAPGFTARLQQAGFQAQEVPVRATGGKRGARHMIWVAVAP
jgi:spermidine synthase